MHPWEWGEPAAWAAHCSTQDTRRAGKASLIQACEWGEEFVAEHIHTAWEQQREEMCVVLSSEEVKAFHLQQVVSHSSWEHYGSKTYFKLK